MKYRKLLGIVTERGMSRSDVADALGIGISALYRRLNGNPDFTIEEAFKIEKLLGEPMQVIFKEAKEDVTKKNEDDV